MLKLNNSISTNSKYIYADRYQRFVNNLCNFAVTARSDKEIDNSPNNVLSGNIGDVLTKDKNYIYYNSSSDGEIVSLSEQFMDITRKTETILSKGINRKASWAKTSLSECSWKFLGYYTFIADRNCCAVNPSERKLKSDSTINPYPIPPVTPASEPDDKDECCHDYYLRLTYGQHVIHESGKNGIIHVILHAANQQFTLSNPNEAVLGDTIVVIVDVGSGVSGVYGCNFNGVTVGTGTSLKLVCAGTEDDKYWKTILTSETII